MKGKFLAIEAKANGGQTTALQDKNLDDIEAAGGLAWVISEDNIILLDIYIRENK
jgi:hypothetical protein